VSTNSALPQAAGYDDHHAALLREMQTQQAEERNKPGGYGIAEADPTAAAIDTFRGPFVDHGCSDSRDMRSTRRRQPTSGFAVFAGQRQHADLGVKGSQVRILSARPEQIGP
jgi:hypothetical protein